MSPGRAREWPRRGARYGRRDTYYMRPPRFRDHHRFLATTLCFSRCFFLTIPKCVLYVSLTCDFVVTSRYVGRTLPGDNRFRNANRLCIQTKADINFQLHCHKRHIHRFIPYLHSSHSFIDPLLSFRLTGQELISFQSNIHYANTSNTSASF